MTLLEGIEKLNNSENLTAKEAEEIANRISDANESAIDKKEFLL